MPTLASQLSNDQVILIGQEAVKTEPLNRFTGLRQRLPEPYDLSVPKRCSRSTS
jgi:hypothetical protein